MGTLVAERGPQGDQGLKGDKGADGIPNAVKTKICTKKIGSGSSEKWMLKHGTDCVGDADAMDVYVPIS